jgi:hypothetical protein
MTPFSLLIKRYLNSVKVSDELIPLYALGGLKGQDNMQ